MGTGKVDPENQKKEEVDNHPDGTRLGHYILGTLKIKIDNIFYKICEFYYFLYINIMKT